MPQAPDYLRAMWADDQAAIDYLHQRGFHLNRDWSWSMPPDRTALTTTEIYAINYLIMEWDFAGATSGLPPLNDQARQLIRQLNADDNPVGARIVLDLLHTISDLETETTRQRLKGL